MQYDLYYIDKDLYSQIILRVSKLNNNVEVASHYTGMLKTDRKGNIIFEYTKDGVERIIIPIKVNLFLWKAMKGTQLRLHILLIRLKAT